MSRAVIQFAVTAMKVAIIRFNFLILSIYKTLTIAYIVKEVSSVYR